MSITSNAESAADKQLVARHEALHPDATHDLRFLSRHVVVFDAANAVEDRYTRKQYKDYLDSLEELGEGSEDALEAAEDAPEALPPQAAEPRSGFAEAPAVSNIDQRMLQDLSDMAFEVGLAERQGDLSKNYARFERGELMLRLASVAQTERTPFKDVLQAVNEHMAVRASENTLADFQLITKEEATTTRRVVEAFGSSAEFRLVNAINPNTGEPLVDDSGEPPLTSIREVPMNKLYAVVDYADARDLDSLLSFAYRYGERVVKKAKSVAKNSGIPLAKLIKQLDRLRREATHVVTGETIKVQADERAAMDKLRDLAGEAPPPEVASIKTDRAWHDTFWVPLRALYTSAMREFNPELMGDGEASNVFVFERTIGQYFNVNAEHGVREALGALVNAEDISTEQASEFLERFSYNPGSGQWEAEDAGHDPLDDDDFEDFGDDDDFGEEEEEDGFEDVEA